jgi:hypothetical protein
VQNAVKNVIGPGTTLTAIIHLIKVGKVSEIVRPGASIMLTIVEHVTTSTNQEIFKLGLMSGCK